MTFVLLLGALILLLYLGMPMYAGMFLFSLVVLLLVEGKVAGVGELAFGKLNVYLLVAIPLFMLMARSKLDQVLVRGAKAGPVEVWPVERRRVDGRLLSDHAPVEVEVA